MNLYTASEKGRHWLHAIFVCLSLCVLLVACDSASQQSLPAVVTSATATIENTPSSRAELETAVARHEAAFATSVALTPPIDKLGTLQPPGTPRPTATGEVIVIPNGTVVALGKQDAETRVAQRRAVVATQIALSPRPTEPDGPIYIESPIPTPTWRVGYGGGIMPENTYNPEYVSCWYGYLNDKLISVCAGHEQLGGDPQQGVIRIRVIEPDQVTFISQDVYETPLRAGVVHIVYADSNTATVASEDGQATMAFDIATRRWIWSTPAVVPSPTEEP